MKRNEQKAKIEELYRQIEELENVEIEEDGVWKPIYGDNYWYIDSFGDTKISNWENDHFDYKRLSFGNVFRTEEEAKHEVERRKVLGELKQFSREFNYDNSNFCLHYNVQNNEFVYHNITFIKSQGLLYFESEEILKQAIEEVGEERIKKYLFGVE